MYVTRNTDIVGNNFDLEELKSLYYFPTFMGCVDTPVDEDILATMSFCISKTTGMIQLNPVLSLNIVYREGHDSGLTGASWLLHHQKLAELINKYQPTSVFEIGGGHGILNAEYVKAYGNIPWTILETNPSPVDGCSADFVEGFYTSETKIDDTVDMIVHSHCLEHFYDPVEFFENTLKLKLGTKMCFSVPNLEAHLAKCYTNVLNFEHTYFCNERIIEFWLKSYGFDILEKQYYQDDHSIFYAAEKVREDWTSIELDNDYEHNKNLFMGWLNYHKNLADTLNKKISDTDQPVFLFGAHVNSQFLLSFGLQTDKITCILDNNTNKHGLRLYGTNLKVSSPKVLESFERPLVILRSGVFNDEIKKDIIENINPDAEFLE